jgi:hypothetical protein
VLGIFLLRRCPILYTDLREVKALLEINNSDLSEDKKLNFIIEQASELMEGFLGRQKFMSKESRTEYYDGTGTLQLRLNARPVVTSPAIQCWLDEQGRYGQVSGSFATGTELTYGTDFYLQIDQPDGSSRSGILTKVNNFWPKRAVRETGYLFPFQDANRGIIKVTYSGGYTVDSLPSDIRLACNMLVAKLRHLFPLGLELASESYEERAISIVSGQRNYLLSLIKPILTRYRSWKW